MPDVAVRAVVSICSGVGGLDLGVELATEFLFGRSAEPVLYVEREAHAAAGLASRMEDGCLAKAPIWSDLFTLGDAGVRAYLREAAPGGLWGVFGGIPCQPWSVAGKQEGIKDERDLWPPSATFIEAHRPAWVLIENVSGFAVRDGLGRVADDLGRMGYRVAAIMLRASDVGASHGRQRLFVLGRLADSEHIPGRSEWRPQPWRESWGHKGPPQKSMPGEDCGRLELGNAGSSYEPKRLAGGESSKRPSHTDGKVANAECFGWSPGARIGCLHSSPGSSSGRVFGIGRSGQAVGYAEGRDWRLPVCEGRPEPGGSKPYWASGSLGAPLKFAPGPNDHRWADILAAYPDLAPALESGVRGVVDGLVSAMDHRSSRLRAIGNGVVDIQASVAFVLLWLALDADGEGA